MGKPKVPNTISDKKWDKIKKGAGKTEAREGGLFGKRPTERRKLYGQALKKSRWS